MKIVETETFRRSFEKLDSTVKKKSKKQFRLVIQNIFHPSLNTEKLEPKRANIWSFRIDRRFRVFFRMLPPDTIQFLYVGSHDIYRKL